MRAGAVGELVATRALLAPVALLGIALLVVNDHVLKAAAPGAVTGKLSDVAGMVFFPLLLAALVELAGVRRGFAAIKLAAIATAVGFAAIKLWPPAGDLYRIALAALQWPVRATWALALGDLLPALGRARLTADPTDLVALPAVLVPLWLARRGIETAAPARPRRAPCSRGSV